MITMKTEKLLLELKNLIKNGQSFKFEAVRSYEGRFGTYNKFIFCRDKTALNGKKYQSVEFLDSRSKKKVKSFLESKGYEIKSDFDATNWDLKVGELCQN